MTNQVCEVRCSGVNTRHNNLPHLCRSDMKACSKDDMPETLDTHAIEIIIAEIDGKAAIEAAKLAD